MATKDRLIGALDDPKSFLDQERVDASIIWLNNGFLEYKIPNPLKNGEKIELLEISMEIASEFPISNNYWPSDLSFYLNNHCIGSYTVPGNRNGGSMSSVNMDCLSIYASIAMILPSMEKN